MKSKRMILTLIPLLIVLCAACGSGLADFYEEETLYPLAEKALMLFEEGDYSAFEEMVREDLVDAFAPNILDGAKAQILEDAGAFDSIASRAAIGVKDAGTGDEDLAQVVMIVKYTGRNVTYRVTFDSDLKVIGFFLS